MNNVANSAPKRSRIGLGIVLVLAGLYSGYTTLEPSPEMARASNTGELVVMLLVAVALALGGLYLIVESRQKPAKSQDSAAHTR